MSRPKARQYANGYASLIQAKKLADAMGGVDKAREALDVLAKLLKPHQLRHSVGAV
jgi:hypothetical protein